MTYYTVVDKNSGVEWKVPYGAICYGVPPLVAE